MSDVFRRVRATFAEKLLMTETRPINIVSHLKDGDGGNSCAVIFSCIYMCND